MRTASRWSTLSGIVAVGFGAFVLLVAALPALTEAQTNLDTAVITRMTGRVEIQRQGQPPWQPVAVGARLAVHDEIRALAGASAELRLPDASTLLLAENSRLVVTRLRFNAGTQAPDIGIVHLVVGKVRATIATAALTLVRARQSNFAISTPGAVAAARGTGGWISHDPGPQTGITPGSFLIGGISGEWVCINTGSFQVVPMFAGEVLRQVGPGGCIRIQLSPADRSALFGPGNAGLENHWALSGFATTLDPDFVEGLLGPAAYTQEGTGFLVGQFGASGPSFTPLSPSGSR